MNLSISYVQTCINSLITKYFSKHLEPLRLHLNQVFDWNKKLLNTIWLPFTTGLTRLAKYLTPVNLFQSYGKKFTSAIQEI